MRCGGRRRLREGEPRCRFQRRWGRRGRCLRREEGSAGAWAHDWDGRRTTELATGVALLSASLEATGTKER